MLGNRIMFRMFCVALVATIMLASAVAPVQPLLLDSGKYRYHVATPFYISNSNALYRIRCYTLQNTTASAESKEKRL